MPRSDEGAEGTHLSQEKKVEMSQVQPCQDAGIEARARVVADSNQSSRMKPKSYLEQDRASVADILPSDRFVGLSISLGHLKLYMQWRGDWTNILHSLTGG